ncbi:MAG: hypothetical protein AAFP00_13545, partial [Bacteroidota bacterium]
IRSSFYIQALQLALHEILPKRNAIVQTIRSSLDPMATSPDKHTPKYVEKYLPFYLPKCKQRNSVKGNLPSIAF